MLELAAEAGISVVGIDSDPAMAQRIRAKGLAVECVDAFEYLDGQPDGSIYSICSIYSSQFIEHLTGGRLIALIQMAYRRLAPGGLFVAEAGNPHSPRALKAFWVDLVHDHPISPESLVVWFRFAGSPKPVFGSPSALATSMLTSCPRGSTPSLPARRPGESDGSRVARR